mmetsp:Transcript_3322/g.7808  ORF Transcript_3322/g.7808 Transcript_3322/m.7808 type:complete len:473 (-) Transcript_3322:90-1508(-)
MWRLKRVDDDDERAAKKKAQAAVINIAGPERSEKEKEEQAAAAGFQHMPQPQIWNGQDARKRGLVFIKILLELTDVDMLEDEYRLKVFPFDLLRIDCGIWMSGQQRMESTDKVDVEFFPVADVCGNDARSGNDGKNGEKSKYDEGATVSRLSKSKYPLLTGTGSATFEAADAEARSSAADQEAAVALDPQKGNRFAVGCRTKAGELEVAGISFAGNTHTSSMTGVQYSDVIFSLHLKRRPQLYLWKGVVPLLLCFLYGVLTTFLHPMELSGRLQTHTALFLTVFAIQWVLAERVPKICYLTLLDHLVFAVVAALTILVFGSCVAYGVGLGLEGILGTSGDGGDASALAFDLKRARVADLATLGVVAVTFAVHFAHVARTRVLRSVVFGGGGGRTLGGGAARGQTAPATASGAGAGDVTIFGTRSWVKGTHVINGVCVPKPDNAFVLEAGEFGVGIAKRLGVAGHSLRPGEAF